MEKKIKGRGGGEEEQGREGGREGGRRVEGMVLVPCMNQPL